MHLLTLFEIIYFDFQKLIYIIVGIPVVGMLLLALLFPETLLQILYGNKYTDYANGIYIMVLFYLFLYLFWPIQISFKGLQKSRPIFLANFIAIFATFSAGVWAIYQWGVYGTIAGQTLNAVIIFIVLAIAYRKFLNHSIPNTP